MAYFLHPVLTPFNLAVLGLAIYALHTLFFQLTTGARRRRMIAERGCKPAYYYPHKGILGRWLGLDVVKELLRTGREGRMQEGTRLRNFANGTYTVQTRRLLSDNFITCEPENIKSVSFLLPLFSRSTCENPPSSRC